MNPPLASGMIQAHIKFVVDTFLTNRPLNVLLKVMTTKSGVITDDFVDVAPHVCVKLDYEDETRTRMKDIYFRMHTGQLINTCTHLGALITGSSWSELDGREMTSEYSRCITVERQGGSGWIHIRFVELNELLGRVVQLSKE